MLIPGPCGFDLNIAGTRRKIDTPVTQDRSPFDLDDTRRELIAMRVKHGAETAVGHRISNLLEQLEALRTATGDQRANLIRSIDKSVTEIKALTPE